MVKSPRRVAVQLELQWPYKRHVGIFAGIEKFAEAHGWVVLIDEFADRTLSNLGKSATPYDGVIARAGLLLAKSAARRGVPVVNVLSRSPARHLLPGVYPDGKEAGRWCAEHLIARGFHNFATLTSVDNPLEDLLVSEFEQIVETAGYRNTKLKMPQSPEEDYPSWKKLEWDIAQWMGEWRLPVGLFVGQEGIGRLVVQTCHNRGMRVPQDVAVIAGQNQETMCEYPRPSLTSVEFGYERIGYDAAVMLERLMDGHPLAHQEVLLPPIGLVVRESTDFIAVDHKVVAAALAYIASHSHRRIGPDEVARAVDTETRTLQNYFQQVIQRPIATEIRRVRIERAKRELAQSKRSQAEIAQMVGFGNAKRLYEVFCREVGLTPSEYRKQRQLTTGQ